MEEHDRVNIIPVLVGGRLSVRQQHMTNISTAISDLPPEQRAIRDRCFHPTGRFVEFKKEEIEQSIPDRFEKIVRLYPDHVAVKMKDHVLTYRQLNATANRIARAILEERGPVNEPVALLFEHGTDLIAAIFGVLKAGKFFLVLDPNFPLERNNSLLEDSGSDLVVTNRQNIDRTVGLRPASIQFINIDALDAPMSAAGFGLTVSPDALAYLIYTSGSTGNPKGVVQNHRNLLHASMSRINSFRICSEDRLTLLSFSSNQAVMNVLSALLNGARLCPFDVKREGANRLGAWLMREGITIYHSSASLFRQFVGTLTGNEDLSSMRLIRSASEAATKNDVELYRKHFSSKCLFANGLSTTETGTSTFYFIDKDMPVGTETVPVGYPLQDMEILLLDEDGNKVGFDCVGEIAIRSQYLALGYWRKPDLTKSKFRPDPEEGGKRIYLTGDFGRISHDGCLEYLGRKEFLVKVRGYRVETGEVELNLLNHPGVKEAAVVGLESQHGDSRLIAYIAPVDKRGPGVSELRGFLKKKLPDYMIPSVFCFLDAIPLTPNGKVDRKALPPPSKLRPNLATSYVAPTSPEEKALANIWTEALGVDDI
ncbi:MAG: amino acid adenylation domain-containing protein, partial [Anaerolineales bacterium]